MPRVSIFACSFLVSGDDPIIGGSPQVCKRLKPTLDGWGAAGPPGRAMLSPDETHPPLWADRRRAPGAAQGPRVPVFRPRLSRGGLWRPGGGDLLRGGALPRDAVG